MKTILCIFTLLILIACNKNNSVFQSTNNCKNISSIQHLEDLNCVNYSENSITISSQKAFDDFFNNCNYISKDVINVVNINFTNNDLIGFKASGTGCSRTFLPTFYTCENENKYIYKVTVNEFGSCEPFETRMVFAIAPKLNSNFSLVFESETIQNP